MPAIPLIGAIGSAASAAAPFVSGAAGIYSAVTGAQQAKKAADAAGNQATAAAGAGQAVQAQQQNAALRAYFDSDPAFLSEYTRVRNAGDTRSPEEWITGHIDANPEEAQKFRAFQAANPSNAIPGSVMGPGGTVDINLAQQAAQAAARQNAEASAALERQYNPGAQELRSGSLEALLARLQAGSQGPVGTLPTGTAPTSAANEALLAQVAAQAGQPLTGVGFDSPALRAAIAKAQADLALGGVLPQDVRNLVARNAFARAGTVGGNLGLGRDIVARDLGLTSLDLERARLQAALQAGGAEAQLEGANAANRIAAQQFARNNLLQSQGATAADENARREAYFRQLAQDSLNYFNQNSLLQSIQSGDFARTLAAAQLGQNIVAPQSGLDPGSIVNLAVGNTNLASDAQQQANALAAQTGNQRTAFGGQLIGSALGMAQNYFKPTPETYTPPTATSVLAPKVFGRYAYS